MLHITDCLASPLEPTLHSGLSALHPSERAVSANTHCTGRGGPVQLAFGTRWRRASELRRSHSGRRMPAYLKELLYLGDRRAVFEVLLAAVCRKEGYPEEWRLEDIWIHMMEPQSRSRGSLKVSSKKSSKSSKACQQRREAASVVSSPRLRSLARLAPVASRAAGRSILTGWLSLPAWLSPTWPSLYHSAVSFARAT